MGRCHVRQNVANHRAIEERAAAWLVKRDSGDWMPADEADLAHWNAQDTAHRVAFLRLEAVDEEIKRLRALGAGVEVPASRSRVWYPALAASFIVALVMSTAVWLMRPALRAEEYATPVGGLESITLSDGSGVTLNTATRLQVELRDHERRVELREGEAYFTVAKDSARPFVVQSGDKRIVAVGTQFAVRREGAEIRIVVTEGSVNLQGDGSAHLASGSVARTKGADVLVQTEPDDDLQALVSWRDGRLTFRDTTLADAVAELNRYNLRHIEIADPGVGSLRISGTFHPTHYEAFVRLLREGYSLHVSDRGETIVLTRN